MPEPRMPPTLWVTRKTMTKESRYIGPLLSAAISPFIIAGAMKSIEAKAISVWLTYICSGRVCSVEALSIHAPNAMSASETK